MKLRGFILLPLGLVAAVSAVAVVGAQKLGAGRAEAWGQSRPAAQPSPSSPTVVLGPITVEVASSPAGTFMGIKDELLLENLHAQPIREVKFNKGGTSISLRLTFADGSRAAFKPLQNNPQTVPRKEVAAYRLNRLLGLNHVPPAVSRTLHRDELVGKLVPEARPHLKRILAETIFDAEGFTRGEASYWIPAIVDSHLDAPESIGEWTRWLTVGEDIPAEKAGLMAQLSSLLVLDMLENNSDRFSGGNLMASPDRQTLYYMDNTFGFQVEPQGHERCRAALFRSQKFSRALVRAMGQLDRHALRAAFAPEPIELSDEEIRGVLARRDVTLRYVDALIEGFGAERVLVFP